MRNSARLTDLNSPFVMLIRLQVGLVFFLEGLKKFLFPEQWGSGRFAHIGIPLPHVSAPVVGLMEVVGGALVIAGLYTRLGAFLVWLVINGALLTTKLPLLLHKGFWVAEAEARADFAMWTGALFLLLVGAGAWSLDHRRRRDPGDAEGRHREPGA